MYAPGASSSVSSQLSQVALVHSTDSIRTLGNGSPSTSIPLNRMSKVPTRVPALRHPVPTSSYSQVPYRPAQKSTVPTMHVPPMTGSTYEQLVEIAEQQRRAIEANNREEDRIQKQKAENGRNIVQAVQSLRREVADEESELRRLSELERETKDLKNKNSIKESDLQNLVVVLEEHRADLQRAASRTISLRKILEDMRLRRQAANAAALVEHRKMQQDAATVALNRSQDRITTNNEDVRPRASVEPFNVIVTRMDRDNSYVRKTPVFHDDEPSPSPPSEPRTIAPMAIPIVSASRQDASPSPPKDPHPTHETEGKNVASSPAKRNETEIVSRPTSFAESLDEARLRTGRTDAVSLRSDSLKATKRRSWAASDGTTMSETDTVKRVLLEEQRRGKTHYLPEIIVPEKGNTVVSPTPMEQSPIPTASTAEEESSSVTTDEEPVEIEMESRHTKGILRAPGLIKEKKKIEFDPLALLLDAALEGELELVQSSAQKLKNVSVANDEGITALHNAICAGHYEIVKFLIESDADVNAQDSDGWTPLHCAASCNNLPMVRQLVEGGACVLASTLSDMETPVEKCEEEEEGYDHCLHYLAAAHNGTGVLNNGKVYAAYDYVAEYDDELSFSAGEELHVLKKGDTEKNWWTCEKVTENGKEVGLAPRTYLALYPALCYRKKLNFIMFNIPIENESQ